MTYLESLNSALATLLEERPEVVVFGEDLLDPYGGAFKVTRGLQSRFPERVLTTPISEAALAGIANGMALRGLRPVLEIMFGDFITLCVDQIVNHGAKFPSMYGEKVTVPVTIRTPVGGGRGYGPTHSQCLEKLLLGVPGIRIVAPSIYSDAGELLKRSVNDDSYVLFIEHKLSYSLNLFPSNSGITIETQVDDLGYPVAMIRNYQEGSPDAILITYGGLARHIPSVLQQMIEEEIRVLVCIPSLIKPFPFNLLERTAKQCGRLVIAEEGTLQWGWGSELSARLHHSLFRELVVPILRIGAKDIAIPATRPLEEFVLPGEREIVRALLEVLQ